MSLSIRRRLLAVSILGALACAGAVVGVLSGSEVRGLCAVRPARKLEGVAIRGGTVSPELWLVADADDRSLRATLYQAPLVL